MGKGRGDSFIDDCVKCFLAIAVVIKRHTASAPLDIHVSMRPNAGDAEPTPRQEMLSLSKLQAEGTPSEVMLVLGWLINTRRLLISLPWDKYALWSEQLRSLIDKGASRKELESLLGRLTHASYVIPLAHNFLSHLRNKFKIMRHGRQTYKFNKEEEEDLLLWSFYLEKA